MHIKVFRARFMAQAMAQVRSELGQDAIILNARRIAGGVEVSAALELEPSSALMECDRHALLAWHGIPPNLRGALAQGSLETAVSRTLSFLALPLAPESRPVMLIGSPGAGKTLTTARLATRLVISGATPLVITTDDRRAGATEQLAAFTRLLGVPLIVACHPAGLARALAQRSDSTPVLIDTAGADPRDSVQAERLHDIVACVTPHVALVLPSGMDPAEAVELGSAFVGCGAVSLVATRLDLARRLGGIVAVSAQAQLPLAEAGIGPGAADGLVPFTPKLLAERLRTSFGGDNAV